MAGRDVVFSRLADLQKLLLNSAPRESEKILAPRRSTMWQEAEVCSLSFLRVFIRLSPRTFIKAWADV